MNLDSQRGQSLVELMIAIAIGVLFITGGLGMIVLSLRVDLQNTGSQNSGELLHEVYSSLKVFADADWHNIDTLTRDAWPPISAPYNIYPEGSWFATSTGGRFLGPLTGDDRIYNQSFFIYDVYRDANGHIVNSGGTLDPSTIRILPGVYWAEQNGNVDEIYNTAYVMRNRNRIYQQTDWVNGPGETTPITGTTLQFTSSTNIGYATSGELSILNLDQTSGSSGTNIHPIYKYAWSDLYGWIDFRISNTVTVTSTHVMGYAQSSNIGAIALDCATTPSSTPNICSVSDFGIDNNGGDLRGFAWNDQIGWIRFDCEDYPVGAGDTCGNVSYGVSIDGSGDFNGWAWNDAVGWISFNCNNSFIGNTCGSSDYKVKTSWGASPVTGALESSPFDTQRVYGAAFNWIKWRGTQPTDTNVKFQIASSDSDTGPWNFTGPDGTSGTYYEPGFADTVVQINKLYHNNKRYVKYLVVLESDPGQTITPTVEDIMLSWSL